MTNSIDKKLQNKIIYQVFVRNYKEGTFRAVEKDLPRIKALGADIIYVMPFQIVGMKNRKGSLGSPYAVWDNRSVDPSQGTMEDFVHLADAVHNIGMQIIVDIVFNHTSPDSRLVSDHYDWFCHKPDGSLGNKIGDWKDVADLDYSGRALWNYQIDTLIMWAKYADGFRCDAAFLVPIEIWLAARKSVEKVRPNCLWIAESAGSDFVAECKKNGIAASDENELYRAFDSCYDYDGYGCEIGVLKGEVSLEHYLHLINMQDGKYSENYCRLRYLENHDQPRIAEIISDIHLICNWTAWLYFMKGAVLLYAGQEFCNDHRPSLYDKDPVCFNTGKDISNLMAKLAGIKKLRIFSIGDFEVKAIGFDKNVIFAKYSACTEEPAEKHYAAGIFSTAVRPQELTVDIPDGFYINEINGEKISVINGIMSLKADPVIVVY